MTSLRKLPGPITTIALVVLTAASWWLFLGRDTVQDVDAATGAVTGPYEAPQVIACAVVLVALVVVGALLIPAWVAVLAVALPFTVAWTIQAATSDDSGLWAIGAVLVLLGTLGGGAIVAAITRGVARKQTKAAS